MRHGFTYILASQRNGTLYTGVTHGLYKRVLEHRSGKGSAFTKRYKVHTLVWYEYFEDIRFAIQRETNLKRWPRKWKLDLIGANNPDWRDLFDELDPHEW
jgi:putative endonuclease